MNEMTGAKIEGSQSERETMRSLIDKGVEYLMPLYVDVHGIARVVRRALDGAVMMQQGLGDVRQALVDVGIFRQHRFAAHVARGRHQRPAEFVQQ